jgi:hypothetical protein
MLMERERLACEPRDAIDALEYWRGRRERLGWTRRTARREADWMIESWERRLRHAVLLDPSLPLAQRIEGGLLVVRTRGAIAGRRWRRRAYVGGMAMAGCAGAGFAAVTGLF